MLQITEQIGAYMQVRWQPAQGADCWSHRSWLHRLRICTHDDRGLQDEPHLLQPLPEFCHR